MMKNFLKNLLIFTCLFFILDKLFLPLLLLFPNLEVDKRLESVIKGEVNKDIIILGSSRGARNIIAEQIQDSLKVSCYNLSYPGSDVTFHEFVLSSLLKYNRKPKIILLAVDDPTELLPNESLKFRYDRLYPLAWFNYINDEMIARDEKLFISKFMVLARLNKQCFDIRPKHFSALDTILECGSMPVSFQRKDRDFIIDTTLATYDVKKEVKDKLEAYEKIQESCLKNNIRLIVVFSPNYFQHHLQFENRLRQLNSSNADFYIYDTTNTIYGDKNYYYDESHLQTKGAVIFTNELIRYLKSKGN